MYIYFFNTQYMHKKFLKIIITSYYVSGRSPFVGNMKVSLHKILNSLFLILLPNIKTHGYIYVFNFSIQKLSLSVGSLTSVTSIICTEKSLIPECPSV